MTAKADEPVQEPARKQNRDYYVNDILQVISNLDETEEANEFVRLYCKALDASGEVLIQDERVDTTKLRRELREIDTRLQ